ncbi:OPT family oligopeptide transporter [Arenibaculum pallidiluteum]|uniref:OPT family oligopeptide transporter n=1 Tax=Arenibaculum pallidiluteum TaxID=2812559 RepID=UPI001A95EE95|nr:oligopeptide transporter, OPT family [Arenibaculum pallidiluteum]
MTERVPDHVTLPELTLRGLVLGALITVVFTASNIYLGLRVGLTFSSSIPAAVISMAILRLARDSNILENNMVQTVASAAGTLSSVIFILPGLVMVGAWQGFPFWYTAGICAIGGTLGVMYTIPLRRAMVVQSDLPYPEGVAAAEILRVGSPDPARVQAAAEGVALHGRRAPGLRDIALGGAVAAGFGLLSGGFRILADSVAWWVRVGPGVTSIGTGFSLALVGAGWLVGIAVGSAMLLGVVIAWGFAVPIITALTPAPAGTDIAEYGTTVWSTEVRFIGAGCIAVAAVWTLGMLLRPMAEGVRSSFAAMTQARGGGPAIPRSERDLPFHYVAAACLFLILPLAWLFADFVGATGNPGTPTGEPAWLLVACAVLFAFVFGFLIAAACGYMAGLVGSSNSPISGIGIVAVMLVSLLLLAVLGGRAQATAAGGAGIALVIFVTSAVIAIAAISNDNLQDLKTGWLVGATPWRQQVALVFGVLVGAAVIPPVLDLLYGAYGFPGALPRPGMDPGEALAAPQATLMAAIATGIFSGGLNWAMILIGMAVGILLIAIDEMLRRRHAAVRLPVLAVGIGIYLPASVTCAIFVGAVLSWIADRRTRRHAANAGTPAGDWDAFAEFPRRRGVLLASGLIVGESLFGVLLAAVIGATGSQEPLALVGPGFAATATWLGTAAFIAICIGILAHVTRRGAAAA